MKIEENKKNKLVIVLSNTRETPNSSTRKNYTNSVLHSILKHILQNLYKDTR